MMVISVLTAKDILDRALPIEVYLNTNLHKRFDRVTRIERRAEYPDYWVVRSDTIIYVDLDSHRLAISSMAALVHGIETIDITNQVYDLYQGIAHSWGLFKPIKTTIELQEPAHD